MNKSERNAVSQAYARIKDWCEFLGCPCGGCPFSVPPYDEDYELPKKKIDELTDRG